MKQKIIFLMLIIFGGAGILLYQRHQPFSQPRAQVREASSREPAQALRQPGKKSSKPATPEPATAETPSPRALPEPDNTAKNTPQSRPRIEETPESRNKVPNEDVGRVLMQILAAKALASDLELAVSNTEIQVTGQVESEDQRRQILQILDGGREYRRIDSRKLRVAPPSQPR